MSKKNHGKDCVICNPIGSRNRKVGHLEDGKFIYSRAKFKRLEDLSKEETEDFDDEYEID